MAHHPRKKGAKKVRGKSGATNAKVKARQMVPIMPWKLLESAGMGTTLSANDSPAEKKDQGE